MAEQMLSTTKRITGLNWDISKNTITIKTFKSINLKKENSEIKIEFLDENRRRCQLSMATFNNLCDLRDSIVQMSSLVKETNKWKCETIQAEHYAASYPTLLLESISKFEFAKALIANLPAVQRFNCIGCQLKSTEHQCLLLSTEEKLQLWFDNLLAMVEERHVTQEIEKHCSVFDFIEKKSLEQFIGKISDNDLCIEMKTDKWKTSLLETAIRLTHLESRFQ